jgi:hypothetical protein
MPFLSNEANIISAIQAIKNNPQLSVRRVAADYNVPRSTLQTRLNGVPFRRDTIANSRTMTELKKQTIVKYVLNLDLRGFSPAIAHIENMANNLQKSRDAPRVGTRWVQRFVNRRQKLKIR